jgi:hypothetical protein
LTYSITERISIETKSDKSEAGLVPHHSNVFPSDDMLLSAAAYHHRLLHGGNSVTTIYDRYSYDKEKKEVLDLWGEKFIVSDI